MAEKVLLDTAATRETFKKLKPIQNAFGGKSACEKIAISVQAIVNELPETGNWAVLQVDISNAFNSIQRQAILQGIQKYAPHLLPWGIQSLQSTTLFCGDHAIGSTEGSQQGAPLSPLFFSLGIQDIIIDTRGVMRMFWYLDDGTIIGSPLSLHEYLAELEPKLAAVGCNINLGKTTIW